ncbi:MAG: tetratricopeptide repeat protein [Anaerolineae bacterium]|nr:tetratricopeptide repeat protein [Anaerolineae bacterium]NIQ82764.1 tetratricopeptide repeat protein [Anaerolineae bacterium]
MAEITLREYCDEAKELIRAESYDRAIAICRHILKHYPRHIRSYRLMGEASLEQGDYVEAANLFKRILSADMEDVVVYAGLGIVYDEEGAVDEAIWQLERAFELTPGNAQVRKELQRLYTERDGAAPPKLKLTPAALGRLYLREGLYQRAIDEFRGVLEEDPDRVDIQVTMALALWWNDQRREAAEVCEKILETFPNCLKANLILGETLLNSDREDEGRALLRTAQAMDPENIVARELFRDQSPLPLETISVRRLDERELEQEVEEISPELPAAAKEAEPEEAPPLIPEEELEEAMPDWLRKLQEGEREPATEEEESPLIADEMPSWLRELATDRAVEPEVAAPAEEKRSPTEEEELPAWVREIGGAPEASQPEEALLPPEVEAEALAEGLPSLEEMEAEPEAISAAEAELPQVAEEEAAAVGEGTSAEPPETGPAESVPIEEPMAMLEGPEQELPEAAPSEVPVEEAPALEDEVPDWLRALRAEEAESVPREQQPASAEEEEVPAWLRELGEEPSEEEIIGPAEVPLEEPDQEQPPTPAREEEIAAAEEEDAEISEETMVHLRETMPDESASIEEIMAWMERSKAMLAGEEPLEVGLKEDLEAPPEKPEEVAIPTPEEELPTWLSELRPEEEEVEAPVDEEAVPIEEKEIPTWEGDLRPEAAEEGAVARAEEPETAVEEAPIASPEEEELPSWLVELRAEAAKEQPITVEEAEPFVEEKPGLLMEEEEIPPWLRSLGPEAVREQAAIPTEEPEVSVEEAPILPTEMEEEEVPSWLRELRAEPDREEAPIPTGEPEAAIPTEEPEAPFEEAAIPRMEEEEIPSWLRELRAEAAREEAVARPEAGLEELELPRLEEDEIPSWLRELRAEIAKGEEAVPSKAEPIVEKALPDVEAEGEPAFEEIGAPPVEEKPPALEVVTAEERAEVAPRVAEPETEELRVGWGREEYRKHLESNPQDDSTRLALARACARNGDWDEAVSEYEVILSHGTMFEEVIGDLEPMAEDAPDHLGTHELLADAYMKGGHLQKALDKYRWLRVTLSS